MKKLSVVVDLHYVRLDQLNSQWWKARRLNSSALLFEVLAPRLLELLEQRFPQPRGPKRPRFRSFSPVFWPRGCCAS